MTWVVLTPIRSHDEGKSRLRGLPQRGALAQAMARDVLQTLTTTRGVDRVVVVTDDPHLGRSSIDLSVEVEVEITPAPLNLALRETAERLGGSPVAVVMADLPGLRPVSLTAALGAAALHRRAVASDATGRGTVLLSARDAAELDPLFGPDSFTLHHRSGAADISQTLPYRARRDVDTLSDVRELLTWPAGGLGHRTRAVIESISPELLATLPR